MKFLFGRQQFFLPGRNLLTLKMQPGVKYDGEWSRFALNKTATIITQR